MNLDLLPHFHDHSHNDNISDDELGQESVCVRAQGKHTYSALIINSLYMYPPPMITLETK